jgi:glycine/D-amino acid oxidase-like deaminating enzyme
MLELPDKEVSLVKPSGFKPKYRRLKSDIDVDTVIVGGGITGLTTAYLLKQAGQKVAVLEKDTIGSGTTGHTTGKVTSQHNLIYKELCERLGTKTAKLYGQANQYALEQINKLIKAEKIDCSWQAADNYVYTADPGRVRDFKNEAKAATSLGLPASFEKTSPLPFKITAAVRFSGQAHFNAQKYIEGLADRINGSGSSVYEQTRAMAFVDGSPCRVKTSGGTVTADNIVTATNVPTLPLMARLSYCMLEYPHSSYLIAGKPKVKLKGMHISPDEGHYSLLPIGKADDQILLVGGQNHIPGLGIAKNRHKKLAQYAKEYFGIEKIEYRWHARDYMAYDSVPLIGKLYPWSQHLYVATAFKKWGLSHSMVAGRLLRDLITGQKNELADIYTPHRTSSVASIPHQIAKSFK